MKRNYLIALVFILIDYALFAQVNPGCGTKLSKSEEIEFEKAMLKFEELNKQNPNRRAPRATYTIPVVFHMLTHGMNNGINSTPLTKDKMKCRIDDAMQVINGDFNGTSTATNSIDPRFQAIRGTMSVNFVLATVDPDGNLMEIPGLDWRADEGIQSGYDPSIDSYLWYGKNGKYYLDVVIVDYPNAPSQWQTASAHAFLPTQNVIPHVAYNHRYIGSTCGSDASAQFAKEFSHEVGHYLGLRHTFEDGCVAPGDGINDTPPTTEAFGCNRDVLNSCNAYANLENLMDYNVSCQSMFTVGQTTVMTNWLNDNTIARYPRRPLWDAANLVAVGITPKTPEARFRAKNNSVCSGESIEFVDQSIGIPTTRNWTFTGGTPSSSTATNPTITYNTPGIYAVTLTVSNGLGNNTITRTAYIRVTNPTNTNISESFTGIFPPEGWKISNPDSAITFSKKIGVGKGDTSCMIINNSDNPTGNVDRITLPYINLSTATNSQFYFDVAYKKYDNSSPDVLKVQVSTNCGTTWTDVYSKTHTQLETTDFTVITDSDSNYWKPTSNQDWRREIINLSPYVGQSNVILRFENSSGYGTRIWIDNINLVVNHSATPITDFKASKENIVCANPISFLDQSTGNPTSWQWNFPGGTPSTSTSQNPTVTYSTPGNYNVTLTTTNASGNGTTVTKSQYIKVFKDNLPYSQNFAGAFPIPGWQIINYNFDVIAWEKSNTIGNGDNSSLLINHADNPADNIDELILTPINMATLSSPHLHFDLAYTEYKSAYAPNEVSPDKIEIYVSNNCGTNWTNVYTKNQSQLQTVSPPIEDNPATPDDNETYSWIPTNSSHWRTEHINLGATAANNSNVLIKFKGISGFGNRVWFDNLIINNSNNLDTSSFEDNLTGVTINPNPAKDEIILGLPTEDDFYTVTIFNTIGQTVYKNKLSGLKNRIELNNQSTGIYFVKVESSNNKTFTKKVVKI